MYLESLTNVIKRNDYTFKIPPYQVRVHVTFDVFRSMQFWIYSQGHGYNLLRNLIIHYIAILHELMELIFQY